MGLLPIMAIATARAPINLPEEMRGIAHPPIEVIGRSVTITKPHKAPEPFLAGGDGIGWGMLEKVERFTDPFCDIVAERVFGSRGLIIAQLRNRDAGSGRKDGHIEPELTSALAIVLRTIRRWVRRMSHLILL